MERIRHAASIAELSAFVLTRLGSQTNWRKSCRFQLEKEKTETSELSHLLHVVLDALAFNVDTGPNVAHGMPHAELVEDIRRIEPGVVANLARDDLERLGESADDKLLLALDRPRVRSEVGRDLHLWQGGESVSKEATERT